MASYWAQAWEHTLSCADGDVHDNMRNYDGEWVYDGDDLDAAKAAVLGFVAENPCTVNYNGDSLYENIGSLTFHEVELYEVADGDGDDIEVMRTNTIDTATAKAWAAAVGKYQAWSAYERDSYGTVLDELAADNPTPELVAAAAKRRANWSGGAEVRPCGAKLGGL